MLFKWRDFEGFDFVWGCGVFEGKCSYRFVFFENSYVIICRWDRGKYKIVFIGFCVLFIYFFKVN